MVILRNLALVVTSTLLSIVAVVVTTNVGLHFFWKGESDAHFLWTLDSAFFSPDYIFWSDSACQSDTCEQPEEAYLTRKVLRYGNCQAGVPEVTYLFVGDSFTWGPWAEDEQTFPAVFGQRMSTETSECIVVERLATMGTGTQQQFARFVDVIDQLHPDVVIWQFFWNDMYEDQHYGTFSVLENSLLRKKNWIHPMFLAGFLNQHIPGLREIALGKYLMYLGESRDLFRQWDPEYGRLDENALIFQQMDTLAKQHSFVWYTTFAPVECELLNIDCDGADGDTARLKDFLKTHTAFLPMDSLTSSPVISTASPSAILGSSVSERLFNTSDDPAKAGWRHLSVEGNAWSGQLLLQNFRNVTATSSAK